MDTAAAALQQVIAAWVQAIGSIGAILVAVWIASAQGRRDQNRQAQEQEKLLYLVNAEIAWLSMDISGFLNQFTSANAGGQYQYAISADDVSDFLTRLSWCRQRAAHKGQLAMIGTLRKSLMSTVRVIRMREKSPPIIFMASEIKDFNEAREKVLQVLNFVNGLDTDTAPQYKP